MEELIALAYDALGTNDNEVAVLVEPELLAIAREMTEQVRANVTIDWTVRENVRAQLRVLVKRIRAQARIPTRKAGPGDGVGTRAGRSALAALGDR